MSSLASTVEQVWLYGAVPALALAGLVLLVLLRLPIFTRVPDAFRAVRAPSSGPGVAPAAPVFLAAAASLGAGAAVGGATAVSLGGAGALAWLWLFGIVLAPLRMADVLLARTSPPGRAAGEPPGNLVGRLEADASPGVRALGVVLRLALAAGASLGVLGVHGEAVRDAAEAALPGSSLGAGVGVAVLAAMLALLGRDKPWLGWVAGVAVVALLLLGFVACLADMGRALGGAARAIDDAFHGAAAAGAFSGALASEVAVAALTHVLPPMVMTLGSDGALHADARGSTKAIAATALLSTLGHVVVASAVGLSLLATGAYSRRIEGERSLSETTFVDAAFDTASQRLEDERQWTGYLRVVDGRAQAEPLEGATERGMIDDTHFVGPDGEPGDFALRVRNGRAVLMLVPDDAGALARAEPAQMDRVQVTGRMLPRGGALVAGSMARIGGDLTVRLALAVLLVLCAVGAAALGLALGRAFASRVGVQGARAVSVLPALALAVAALLGQGGPTDPSLSTLGLLGAGIVALVVALAVLAKSVEVARL
jgi:AGCS family alanine or glycine:cation symporter